MSRSRGDPERIREAQRIGTIARLRDVHGLTGSEAEQLLDRWELEAARRGIDRDDRYQRDQWLEEQLRP